MADSETSSLHGGRSRRAWTVSAESEAMESSDRSNGRSSIDSTAERPRTQGGEPETARAGSSGISKLLSSRRRWKKKNQKQGDEPPVPGATTEFDLQESRSNESRDSNSVLTSSNNSSVQQEGEVNHLLTDNSEPDRYAIRLMNNLRI